MELTRCLVSLAYLHPLCLMAVYVSVGHISEYNDKERTGQHAIDSQRVLKQLKQVLCRRYLSNESNHEEQKPIFDGNPKKFTFWKNHF